MLLIECACNGTVKSVPAYNKFQKKSQSKPLLKKAIIKTTYDVIFKAGIFTQPFANFICGIAINSTSFSAMPFTSLFLLQCHHCMP
jgi:hypothetical protein